MWAYCWGPAVCAFCIGWGSFSKAGYDAVIYPGDQRRSQWFLGWDSGSPELGPGQAALMPLAVSPQEPSLAGPGMKGLVSQLSCTNNPTLYICDYCFVKLPKLGKRPSSHTYITLKCQNGLIEEQRVGSKTSISRYLAARKIPYIGEH